MRSILLALLLCFPALVVADDSVPVSDRGLKICVSADAPQPVKDAANQVLAAVGTQPLLVAMAGGSATTAVTDSAALLSGPVDDRAYNHLVVVGLPDDPIIKAAWQEEALVSEKGIYVFGFGNLQGDIGYIESDRNPFMHGKAIKSSPFETEIVTLTGTTPEGVRQAVAAFLAKGLINGVVAGPGWSRGEATLLDRDPLSPGFTMPAAPPKVGNATCVGVTNANESVCRGVLESAGVKPLEIWQFKYYVPGAWDGAGLAHAIAGYLAGLHRTAPDNTLWVSKFTSAAEATAAAQIIADKSKWPKKGAEWIGNPVPLPKGSYPSPIPRTLCLWAKNDCVYMSTVPDLDSTSVP